MESTKEKIMWAVGSLAAVTVISASCLLCIWLTTPATCEEIDISVEQPANEFLTTVNDTQVMLQEAQAEQIAAKEAAERAAEQAAAKKISNSGSSYYSSSGDGVLTRSGGVNYYNGRKETWYSQRVLPGGGLDIPGRHVAEDGTVRDEDGYICVAASDLEYGSTVETSLGTGKVYDTGCSAGTTDIYTDW